MTQGPNASCHVAFTFTDGRRSGSRLTELLKDRHARLNVDALAARSFALPPTEPDETPYLGIACSLTEPAPREPVRVAQREEEAPRALRRALESSVERALGEARTVAVMAGGGLDSAGLLALAVEWAKPRGAKVFAVAIDFEGRCDDRPYLEALEASLACEVVRIRPEDGARHLRWLDGVDEAPFFWPTAPMEIEMMVRAKERGADCVLMGVGGDEIFDGEPHALARKAARGDLVGAVRQARSLRGFGRARFRTLSWIARPLIGRITPRAVRMRLARRRDAWIPSWAGRGLARYIERIRARDLRVLERNLARGVIVDSNSRERHRLDIAWLRHQEEIVSGIERRDPYLDRELIATVAGFEPDWLLHGGIRRGLFREALRDLLPTQLLERTDKAFFEPAFLRLFGGPRGIEAMRELASGEQLAALELVEPTRFRDAFDAFVMDPENGERWGTIWPALCVERFLRARAHRGMTAR